MVENNLVNIYWPLVSAGKQPDNFLSLNLQSFSFRHLELRELLQKVQPIIQPLCQSHINYTIKSSVTGSQITSVIYNQSTH